MRILNRQDALVSSSKYSYRFKQVRLFARRVKTVNAKMEKTVGVGKLETLTEIATDWFTCRWSKVLHYDCSMYSRTYPYQGNM